jgi:hypothetical protein
MKTEQVGVLQTDEFRFPNLNAAVRAAAFAGKGSSFTKVDPLAFGIWCRQNKGRIVDGLRLANEPSKRGEHRHGGLKRHDEQGSSERRTHIRLVARCGLGTMGMMGVDGDLLPDSGERVSFPLCLTVLLDLLVLSPSIPSCWRRRNSRASGGIRQRLGYPRKSIGEIETRRFARMATATKGAR